jgi:hypothetical protein
MAVQEYLPQVFERSTKEEFRYSSPLYERLSLAITKDSELLTLAGHGRRGERIPNLLFAAVHFLLLNGVQHPLRRFYPSLPEFSAEASGPYADFRSFCMDHAAEIRQQISARLVQTNEVRRCAGLVPAFEWVRRLAKDRPLHLVDIGTSAGLNLLWDHYAYEYGTAHRCGELSSLVKIKCALRGNLIPPIPLTLPQVSARIGLDLNPLDVHHPEDALWATRADLAGASRTICFVGESDSSRAAMLADAASRGRSRVVARSDEVLFVKMRCYVLFGSLLSYRRSRETDYPP